MKVAAVQLTSTPDPVENLRLVRESASRAADDGALLLVFPEATMARFGTRLAGVAQPLDGPFADGVRTLASVLGVVLVVGMFTPAADGRVHNTLLATNGADVDASYRKIHLFDAFRTRESETVAPGSQLVTFEAWGTTVGLATCYDVRFADQFTALGRLGAQIICLPASWADGPRKDDQWDALVTARAMDAQAFLVAADQAFTHTGGKAPLGIGRSAIVGPLGQVLGRLGGEPGELVATLDLAEVASARAAVPIL
ncbi:MAG TPA: nitrilase-related carbon-nitrogen hydrolase [Propionibacteriaceae bacterium]|nr:nitrilase-related carbon-nitrogen hydrolase [Propionibacteriaceae bacterium]